MLVEDLLAEHGQLRQDSFLPSPVALLDNPSEAFAGTIVGAYTLFAGVDWRF